MASNLHSALEIAFNRYLSLDPESPARLRGLEGRVVALELSGARLELFFYFTAEGIKVLDALAGEPDTLLRGSPAALLRLAREGAAGAGQVEIRGDVDLARRFENLLGKVDVDWEEQLSGLVGDVAAHHLARAAQGLMAWGRDASASLQRDVAEYLREESRLNPRKEEVEAFIAGVDELRSDCDRLEARLRRLEG